MANLSTASSTSVQLREQAAWFWAAPEGGPTADGIRAWVGNLGSIRCVAKYTARMGQCFSTTYDTLRLEVLFRNCLSAVAMAKGLPPAGATASSVPAAVKADLPRPSWMPSTHLALTSPSGYALDLLSWFQGQLVQGKAHKACQAPVLLSL